MPANIIDEYSFRLNEGNCKIHTLQRMENLCKAVKVFQELKKKFNAVQF